MHRLFVLPVIGAAVVLMAVSSMATDYHVTVKGRVLCHGKPITHQFVRLYEKDASGAWDSLGNIKTDENGSFEIYAHKSTRFEPFLVVKHKCDYSIFRQGCSYTKICKKKFIVPEDKISLSRAAGVFDMGDIITDYNDEE